MNVCSLLAALRADSGWEEGGEGHDWCWSIRCASCLSHSAVPQSLAPPAEVEGAWDALEGQRDAIEFDRICTTN